MLGLYWVILRNVFLVVEASNIIFLRVISGLYWDNGKENGKCYNGVIRV